MAQVHITPRRVTPYVVSGATGVHVLARMHRLSRQPATDAPLHFFLLKHTDVVLALGASIIVWHRAHHPTPRSTTTAPFNGSVVSMSDKSLIADVVHELRQIFTALLIGLGLINRKAHSGDTEAIPALVQRLTTVVRRGIDAVNMLEPSDSTDGYEREHGA
jgi:hypothetical protein